MTVTAPVPFFGGYIPHCFKNIDDSMYAPKLNEGAYEALLNGRWFTRLDGASGVLIYNDESKSYDLYQRYDDKNNKFQGVPPKGYINLPQSKNPSVYKGRYVTHRYYLRFQPRPPSKGRGSKGVEASIWRNLYLQIDQAHREGKFNDSQNNPVLYHAIELVGKNFSTKPRLSENRLILQSEHEKCIPVWNGERTERTVDEQFYEHFLNYFKTVSYNNIIVEYEGLYWRITVKNFS